MILRTLLLIAGLLVCLTINAEKWWQSQFKIDVDGIVYDIGCYHNTDDGTSVEYEAILYDGKSCFGDIVIPEEVTHFDSGGTYKVTTIGASAFENCTDLRSVIIPESVENIESGAFNFCTGLTSIIIPESVENIESGAFANCTGLTSVNIPKSVKIIEPSTFGGCSSLTSIIIPDSVVEIQGDYRGGAFEHCTSLKNVIIGNSVTTIGCRAFYNCSSLTSITIPNSVKEIKGDYGHCVYGGAFEHCTSLKYVIFGNSLTKIGDYVFRGCTDLRTITIPNSMNEIAYGAFTGCTGLVSVNLGDSIKTIIHEAFKGCTSLQSIIIPNSIKDILRGVFEDCTGLKSVTFGDSVKTIGSFAFNGCTSLTDVNLGSSLQEIENSAFEGCISLKSIVIPNSVTTIGQNAFNNCSNLTSLTLGEAVVEIEGDAFLNCASLEEIYSLNPTPPGIVPIGNSHSPFNSYDATLYVPKGSLQFYKSAPVWELFLKIKEIGAASECIVTIPANVEHGTLVVMNGTEALVAGENEVEANTKLTITATPDEGYVLETLTVNGADFTNGNSYTVTENTNIAVSFVKAPAKKYMMRWNIEGDGEGTITVTDSNQNSYAAETPVVEGTKLTVTFKPAEHSLLKEAKINDKSILDQLQNNSYTFIVTEDFMITALYAAIYEVTLNKESVTLKATESFQLEATVSPVSTTDKTILWSSTNEEVANVDANGKVTALSVGNATITATCGEVSAQCAVQVVPTPAAQVTLNKESVTLKATESFQLEATVSPASTTDKTIRWSSTNEEVAKVDASGKVTALSVGNATITATCGEVSAQCAVQVEPVLPTGIELELEQLELNLYETFQLVATVSPANVTDASVMWSSSRPDVVQVDDQGLVTALSVGQATITATDMEGHSATCEVKVSDDLSIEVLESLPAGKVLIFNLKGILQTAKFKDLPRGWYIVNGRKVRKP